MDRLHRILTETEMTASTVEWIHLDSAAPDALRVGDVVSAAAGGLPTYRVVALSEARAWIWDEDHRAVREAPINQLYWKMATNA